MEFVLLLLALGFFWLARDIRRSLYVETQGWGSVQARVVGYLEKPRKKFAPVIQFFYSGTDCHIVLPGLSHIPQFPLQARLTVRVSPGESPRFSVDQPILRHLAHIFIALGILFGSVALLVVRLNLFSLGGALFLLVPLVRILRTPNVLASLRAAYDQFLFPQVLSPEAVAGLKYFPPEQIATVLRAHQLQVRVLGVFLILFSAGGFYGGEAWLKHRNEFLRQARPASGKVVRLERSSGSRHTSYYPVVQFREPASQQTVEFRHRVGSNPPLYRVGEEVGVLYSPNVPRDAMIDGGNGLFNLMGPLVLLFSSMLFLFLGGVCVLK